jgi:recombinational DNA repair protein (RecF pathway)
MLDELGYGLVLDSEYESGQPVVMSKNYKYIFGLGVTSILNQSEEGNFFSGEELLGIYNNEFNDLLIDRAARRLLRGVFDFYLEGKQMNSRELYRQYLEGIRNNASNVRSIK